MNLKRRMMIPLLALLCLSALSWGAGQNEATKGTVTLHIYLPGDPQPDQDIVTQAIMAAAKDELNAKLVYTSVPWGDYGDKVKLLAASGGDIDVFWTHPELMDQMTNAGSLAPLDAVLPTAGAALLKNIPAKYWDTVKRQGKIYGVPSAQLGTSTGQWQTVVRKDLRVKYGLPEIKTLADLETFFAAVKKNNPEMTPYILGNTQQNYSVLLQYFIYAQTFSAPGVYIDLKTLKAAKATDSPALKQATDVLRGWFTKGYIPKDIFTIKDVTQEFYSGKTASENGGIEEYNNAYKQLTAIPGATAEFVKIITAPEQYLHITTWNFQSVAASSKNIDRAVRYMNWIQENQKNYDLLTLGIEGRHYVLQGNKVALPVGIDPAHIPYAPFEWIWQNPLYLRDRTTNAPGYMDQLKAFDAASKFVSPILAFSFDATPVKTEVAAVTTIASKYGTGLMTGAVSYDDVKAQLVSEMNNAGIDKVVAELQRQLDAFMAGKK